jgi:hypothetical protein
VSLFSNIFSAPFLWERLPIFCKIRQQHPQICFKTWGSEKRKAWILHGQDRAILLRQNYPVKGDRVIFPSIHKTSRCSSPTARKLLNAFQHSFLKSLTDFGNKMPHMQEFVERCRQLFPTHTNMVIADI